MDATQTTEWHAAPHFEGRDGRPGDAAGIDAGGTLVKIAYVKGGVRRLCKFRSDRLTEAADWLRKELPAAPLCLTGGKGAKLAALIGRDTEMMPEFEATCAGIRLLLPPALGESAFLLANVGTGTSVHVIDGERNLRIGGTGLGGGTIVGLARLLTGLDEYEAIVTAAAKGDRGTADLKVRHIYEGMEPPIDGDLTASNFGRVFPGAVIGSGEEGSISREDALASVIGMVGEAVATLCVHAAAAHGVKDVVYIGSSFNGNAPLRQAVESYTRFRGGEPHFVENGEFSGALGALLRLGRG
ncbi:MAG: type II pantothenate kinase [Paenibacillaceae bacterium]|nr:MAG: type II pantothenate kinase [Paenibacillaceae bacterium]